MKLLVIFLFMMKTFAHVNILKLPETMDVYSRYTHAETVLMSCVIFVNLGLLETLFEPVYFDYIFCDDFKFAFFSSFSNCFA